MIIDIHRLAKNAALHWAVSSSNPAVRPVATAHSPTRPKDIGNLEKQPLKMLALVLTCPGLRAGVPVASAEAAARAAWLAKNLPTRSGAGKVSADSLAEGQAVPAWLSDGLGKVSTWSQAAGALRQAAAEFSALAEACGSGDDVACATLTREEASKRAWLERLDAPTWAKTASPAPLAALSSPAVRMAAM